MNDKEILNSIQVCPEYLFKSIPRFVTIKYAEDLNPYTKKEREHTIQCEIPDPFSTVMLIHRLKELFNDFKFSHSFVKRMNGHLIFCMNFLIGIEECYLEIDVEK